MKSNHKNPSGNQLFTKNDFTDCFSSSTNFSVEGIRHIRESYQRMRHPNAPEIINLLNATENFLSATTLSDMQKERANFTDADLKKILDDMGEKLNIITISGSEISDENIRKIIFTATTWCETAINKRLEELSKKNDRVFTIYKEKVNELNKFIAKPPMNKYKS